MKKIVFRVDSSRLIGSGHTQRCLALAQTLREKGCDVSFLSRALTGSIHKLPESLGFRTIELPAPQPNIQSDAHDVLHGAWREVDLDQDIVDSRAALESEAIDCLIVDHYGLWSKWHLAMRDYTTKLMVIDDLGDRLLSCDVLVDHNLGATRQKYHDKVSRNVLTLLGSDFCMIRSDFKRARDKLVTPSSTKTVLINFGGDDYADYSKLLLDSFLHHELDQDTSIDIVIGKESQKVGMLRAHPATIRFKTRVFGFVDNMAGLLSEADLAVGAAGVSSWERCCLGLPTLLLPVATNQLGIADNLVSAGVAWKFSAPDIQNGIITKHINEVLGGGGIPAISERAKNLVDGLGCERIAEIILN